VVLLWWLLLLCALSGVRGAVGEKFAAYVCSCCCWAESCANEVGDIVRRSTRGVVPIGDKVPEYTMAGDVGERDTPPMPPLPLVVERASIA
jgi:hypothetical protein